MKLGISKILLQRRLAQSSIFFLVLVSLAQAAWSESVNFTAFATRQGADSPAEDFCVSLSISGAGSASACSDHDGTITIQDSSIAQLTLGQSYTGTFSYQNYNDDGWITDTGFRFTPPEGFEVLINDGMYINEIHTDQQGSYTFRLEQISPSRVALGAKLLGYPDSQSDDIEFRLMGLFLQATRGQTGITQPSPGFVGLMPDKEYFITISGDGTYNTLYSVPNGYELYIDDEKRTNISGSVNNNDIQHKILLKSVSRNSFSGSYGDLVNLDTGPAKWAIALGSLINGQSTGFLSFEHTEPTLDLIEEIHFSDVQEDVEVIKEQLVPRQIKTNQMLLDILESQDSVTLDFYPQSAVGSLSNGLYTFSGQPSITYSFTRQSAGASYTLTRTEGSRAQTYNFNSSASIDSLQYPNSLKSIEKTIQSSPSTYEIRDTTIKRSGGLTDYLVTERHDFFDFGKKLTSRTSTVNSTAYTQSITYDENEINWGSYGRPTSTDSFGGATSTYAYSTDDNSIGRVTSISRTHLDNQASTQTFEYATDWNGTETLVSNISQTNPISQDFDRTHTYTGDANGEPLNHIAASDFTGTGYELSDIEMYRTHLWDTVYVDLPYSAKGPDGRKVSYLYQKGHYDGTAKTFLPDGIPTGASAFSLGSSNEYIEYSSATSESFSVNQPGKLHVGYNNIDFTYNMEYWLTDPNGDEVFHDDGGGVSMDYIVGDLLGNYRAYVKGRDPSDSGNITIFADLTPYTHGGQYWRETRFHGWEEKTTDPEAYSYSVSRSGGHLDSENFFRDNNFNNDQGYYEDTSSNEHLWIRADLGSPKFVAKITVAGGSVNGNDVDYHMARYAQIQKSDNGSSWTTVHDFGSQSFASGRTIEVNDTARYWRLYKFDDVFGCTEFRLTPNADFEDPVSISSQENKDISALYLVEGKSIKEITIRDRAGYIIRSETHLYTGEGADGFELLSWADITNDETGNVTRIEKSNGEILEWEYTDGLMTAAVNATGIRTEYQHDALGRVIKVIRKGVGAYSIHQAQSDIVTDYTYNALDQILSKVTSSGGLSQSVTYEYDTMGRITKETRDPSLITTWSYSKDPNSGLITTVTYPNGAVRTTKLYKDGRVKEVAGDAVVNEYYTQDGDTVTVNYSSPASSRLSNVTFDSLYRAKGVGGTTSVPMDTTRDAFGRVIGNVPSVDQSGDPNPMQGVKYQYNIYGELQYTAASNNPNLDLTQYLDTAINLTEHGYDFENDASGHWWHAKSTSVFPMDGDETSVTTSIVKTRLTGFSGGTVSEVLSTDVHGNATIRKTTIERGDRIERRITDTPRSTLDIERVSYNGRLVEETSREGHMTVYRHDALGRQIEIDSPNLGVYKKSWCTCGRLEWEEDPEGNRTTYSYDSEGRLETVTNPQGKTKIYGYNTRNQVTSITGDVPHPITIEYDDYGNIKRMNNGGWVQWDYDLATGLLLSKGDDDGKAVTHQYDAVYRRIKTINSRGIEIDYTHDGFGKIKEIAYSDGTPGVIAQRDRMSRLVSIDDDVGQRIFVYDPTNLQLLHEQLPAELADKRITRSYATSGVNIGRFNGFSLGTASDPDMDYLASYGFDAFGRLDSVSGPSSSGSRSFDYTYGSDSNTIERIDELASGFAQSRTIDPVRGLLSSIESSIGSTVVARFDYRYDELRRRTDVAKSGQLYNVYGPSGLVDRYAYNDRNELTSAETFIGSDPEDLTLPKLPNRAFTFVYDEQGNRTNRNRTDNPAMAESATYNSLNQLTASDHKTVVASGFTDEVASVAVSIDGAPAVEADQEGTYWSKALTPNNAPSSYMASLDVYAGMDGEIRHESLSQLVKKDGQSQSYDDDGNVTSDGRWIYTWNATNRLIQIETANAFESPQKRLHFDYDYLGRRWQKEVYEKNGPTWELVSKTKYVYETNGWNLIAELNALNNNAVIRTFTWGKDLKGRVSGTEAGAGGVGGLLMLTEDGNDYLASYDGNGNLMALSDAADGSLAAAYEYSPYGSLLRVEGPMSKLDPFRFSTKYTDDESGLVYFGLRFYNPDQGRWINRDPIEERGGQNLYVFAWNDPINKFDVLGMKTQQQLDEYLPFVELDPFEVKGSDGFWDKVGNFFGNLFNGGSGNGGSQPDWDDFGFEDLEDPLDDDQPEDDEDSGSASTQKENEKEKKELPPCSLWQKTKALNAAASNSTHIETGLGLGLGLHLRGGSRIADLNLGAGAFMSFQYRGDGHTTVGPHAEINASGTILFNSFGPSAETGGEIEYDNRWNYDNMIPYGESYNFNPVSYPEPTLWKEDTHIGFDVGDTSFDFEDDFSIDEVSFEYKLGFAKIGAGVNIDLAISEYSRILIEEYECEP